MAAAAAAAALVFADMDAYLLGVIGVTNVPMRGKLIAAGFRDLNALVKKKDDFAHKACVSVRKSTTGVGATRDVSMETETRLEQLVQYSKYRYMVQRPMDYNDATLDNLETVHDWVQQLPEDPNADVVPKFTDGGNKKQWFESLRNYLAQKKGTTGFPILMSLGMKKPCRLLILALGYLT